MRWLQASSDTDAHMLVCGGTGRPQVVVGSSVTVCRHVEHIPRKWLAYERHSIQIDLNGPDGNAFALLGLAKRLAKQLEKDGATIVQEMQSRDYDHLLQVFDREFGEHVMLYP